MEEINYQLIEETYRKVCEENAEPNLIILASIKRTKAVRRKIGRLLKRKQVVIGECLWPFTMKNKFGTIIVR